MVLKHKDGRMEAGSFTRYGDCSFLLILIPFETALLNIAINSFLLYDDRKYICTAIDLGMGHGF